MVDILHDTNLSTLAKLREKVSFPKYVLNHDLDEEPEIFAWTEKRAFPICSPASTYLSIAYNLIEPSAPESVEQAMIKAAAIHGIESDIQTLIESFIEVPPQEENPFLLQEKTARGESVSLYPVQSKEDWQEAHDDFTSNYNKYPPEWREKIAEAIVKKAPEGEELSNTVMAYSKKNVCNPETFRGEMAKRATYAIMLKKPREGLKIKSIKDNLSVNHLGDRECLTKLAMALTDIDEMLGIPVHYGETFCSPHEAIFNTNPMVMMQKIASSINMNGEVYPLSKVSVHIQGIGGILGPDFEYEIEKDSSSLKPILETLPRDMSFMVKNFLKGRGVSPCDRI